MGIDEFMMWNEYDKIDPIGKERDDLNMGIIASTIANVNRDPKTKAMTAEQFMPKYDKPKKVQTIDEMLQIAEVMTIGLGGKDLRKKK